MRILAIYYTHKPGGLCKRLYRLLDELSTEHDVYFLSLDDPTQYISKKVHWIRIPFWTKRRSGLLFWLSFLLFGTLYAAVRSRLLKIEKLVAFSPFYAALLSLAAKLSRSQLILFCRLSSLKAEKLFRTNPLLRTFSTALERLGLKRADSVICITASMGREFEEELGSPICLQPPLPNDIPTHPSAAQHASRVDATSTPILRIAAAGILEPRKNFELLVAAIRTMSEGERERFEVDIFGSGPLETALRNQASSVPQIAFRGWEPELSGVLPGYDLFIHPSKAEGSPNAVLEALGAGLPVLLSDIPEHRELCRFNINLLFSTTDPAELRQKLLSLSLNPDENKLIRTICSSLKEEYSFDWSREAAARVTGSYFTV